MINYKGKEKPKKKFLDNLCSDVRKKKYIYIYKKSFVGSGRAVYIQFKKIMINQSINYSHRRVSK